MASSCSSDPETTKRVLTTNWVLRSAPQGDVLDVTVAVGSSTCNSFEGFDVDESDTDVRVVARWGSRGGGCTDDLRTTDEQVRLARPLGDRELTGCNHGVQQAPRPWGTTAPCRDVFPPFGGPAQ